MARCSKCGATIEWLVRDGLAIPVNRMGEEHFAECRAARFQHVRKHGVLEEHGDHAGYRHEGKLHLTRIDGNKLTGSASEAPECVEPCGLPPWEVCACSRWPISRLTHNQGETDEQHVEV